MKSCRHYRVKGTIGGTTTTYIGNYFEWVSSISNMNVKPRYYYAGNTRVAMRTGSSTINYLLGDHPLLPLGTGLGSTAITTNSSGVKTSEIRYYPWGTERYTYGTTPTTFKFTGQRKESNLNLYWYGSRWFDPLSARFIQPDTIVPEPNNPLAYDRYQYVYSNPLKYIDPTGYCGLDANNNFDGKFDCDAETINSWSMEYRQSWFTLFLQAIGAYDDGWFNNIIGILEAFQVTGEGKPGSWISWADAGILVSIQNGWAQYKFGTQGLGVGVNEWAAFFTEYKSKNSDSDYLTELWGKAEKAGTSNGISLANKYNRANSEEELFLAIGNNYRGILATTNGGQNLGSELGYVLGVTLLFPTAIPPYLSQQIGGYLGNRFFDPRSTVFGHSPVYYVTILIFGR